MTHDDNDNIEMIKSNNTFQTVKRTFAVVTTRQIVHSLVQFCGRIIIILPPMVTYSMYIRYSCVDPFLHDFCSHGRITARWTLRILT